MCGIVGYVGTNSTKKILIEGLKSLEYRGYDSSGIALKNNKEIKLYKSVGKIVNLEEKIKNENFENFGLGIAHTRWATHGEANEVNAHPHIQGKVTIVHNGIIENYKELKEQLVKEGITFNSETDTEVVAALLNKYLEKDIIKTINKVMKLLKGSYALGILIDDSDKIYVAKKDSPLVIGLGKNENFFASDITAINIYTNKFIFLNDYEVAEISKENVILYKNGNKIEQKVDTINIDINSKGKNGYPHYMLKEINEEPIVLEKTLKPYLNNFDLLPDLTDYDEIHIVACGSAMYAGMIGKILFEEKTNTKTIIDVASEYRYKNNIYNNKTLVIVISQSGETADTIAALKKAKEQNIDTLAIVNVKTSTIARLADKSIFIEAGEEIAVATTKAYLLQVAVISLLALKTAKDKKILDNIDKYIKEFEKVPQLVKNIIDKTKKYEEIAKEIYNNEDIFFIGRKLDYAISLEGSLKLKEISYIHSEAYQAGELKHGTISLIDKGMPVFGIITDNVLAEKTISNIIEVSSRGAKTIIIAKKELKQDNDLEIDVDNLSDFTIALEIVPILQLIAYETAKLRKCDIDKPKNLAKSVTVE